MRWQHIEGWVQVTGPEGPTDPGWGNRPPPVDPGYDRPGVSPIDPGWGTRPPVDPGYDRPSGGHPGGGPIKPPGRPILPSNPIYTPPPAHPWLPGHWEILDPGFGHPPILGFLPVDPGFGIPIGPPAGGKPPGGIWVPVDPDWGKPVHPCPPVGGKPHPPIWAWIPDRPPMPGGGDEGKATVTLYPTTGTAPAAGGSGSVNPTLTSPGSWEISAASIPDWLSASPLGPQTEDVQILYTASKNSTGKVRTAVLEVNGATFTLNQTAS